MDPQAPTGQGTAGKLIRALVVDDKADLANLMAELLGEIADVNVVAIALGGELGLELATTCQIDLVLTDIDMPETNGLRLTSLLRERLPKICIVATSGDGCWAKAAVANGADSFISKPDLVDRLADEIERLRQKGALGTRRKDSEGDDELRDRLAGD